MKSFLYFFLFFSFLTNGFAQKSLLQLENDSLNATDKDWERFNRDNKIYKSNMEFVFDCSIVKNSDSLQCQLSKQEYGIPNWQLLTPQNADSLTVNRIGLLILPYYMNDNQTGMKLRYYNKKGRIIEDFEATGLVENDKNVWLHPMRWQFFAITEFNSFPYIKAPYVVGTKWQAGLGIGYFDSYKRFGLTWDGVLDSKEDLEIIDKVALPTALGNLECFVIQGLCKTKLTDTKTFFYFNETYGFVKIVYDLFDKTRL